MNTPFRMQPCRPAKPLSSRATHRRGRGVTLIDVLVALAVAMLTMVLVYATFTLVQSARRAAASAGDLQANGAFALSTLAIHVAKPGAGSRQRRAGSTPRPAGADIATTLRPVYVLIADGGAPDRPDSLVVRQSLARTGGVMAAFVADALPASPFRIAAVDGDQPAIASSQQSDRRMCIDHRDDGRQPFPRSPRYRTRAGDGRQRPDEVLLNLGAATPAAALRLDVAAGSLRSTDLTNGDAPQSAGRQPREHEVPVCGVDSDDDGALDAWVVAAEPGPWGAAALMVAPRDTLERIQAIRIGSSYDRSVPNARRHARTTGFCSIANSTTRPPVPGVSRARSRRPRAAAIATGRTKPSCPFVIRAGTAAHDAPLSSIGRTLLQARARAVHCPVCDPCTGDEHRRAGGHRATDVAIAANIQARQDATLVVTAALETSRARCSKRCDRRSIGR